MGRLQSCWELQFRTGDRFDFHNDDDFHGGNHDDCHDSNDVHGSYPDDLKSHFAVHVLKRNPWLVWSEQWWKDQSGLLGADSGCDKYSDMLIYYRVIFFTDTPLKR